MQLKTNYLGKCDWIFRIKEVFMILITGGTGFVGASVVKKGLEKGLRIKCLVRNPNRAESILTENTELVQGDILNSKSLEQAMAGVNTVIHLVGIIVETKGASFEAVHYHGTVNVVEAAKKAGVKRYLHMSALGTRAEAKSKYHKTKWQAEEYVRSSNLSWTIFRPSIIFGQKDEFLNMLIQMVKLSPVIPIIGRGKGMLQPIWVEDVAECFIRALDKESTIGKVFELGGPDKFNIENLIDLILKIKKKNRCKIHLPISFMKLNAAIMETVLAKPPLTTDQLTMLEEDNTCDIETMEKEFGIEPKRVEEYLKECL